MQPKSPKNGNSQREKFSLSGQHVKVTQSRRSQAKGQLRARGYPVKWLGCPSISWKIQISPPFLSFSHLRDERIQSFNDKNIFAFKTIEPNKRVCFRWICVGVVAQLMTHHEKHHAPTLKGQRLSIPTRLCSSDSEKQMEILQLLQLTVYDNWYLGPPYRWMRSANQVACCTQA